MSRHISGKVKKSVFERDKGKCVYCGTSENLVFDHTIPISKGGSNSEENLQLICMICYKRITRFEKTYEYNSLLIVYGIIMNSLDILLTFILLGFFGYREANPFWARYIYKNPYIVLLGYLPFIIFLIVNTIIFYVGIEDLELIWKIYGICLFFYLVFVGSYRTFVNIGSLLALFKELVNLI